MHEITRVNLRVFVTLLSFASAGFKEQIYDVYRYLPPATQVCLISATLPHEILEMTNKFMTDPIRILVKRWGAWTGLTTRLFWLQCVYECIIWTYKWDEFKILCTCSCSESKRHVELMCFRLSAVMNWHWRGSSSSSWPSSERSGSLTRCVTCTTRWPSHRPSSSATPNARSGSTINHSTLTHLLEVFGI